ncbi:MAG: hypothetical protein ABS79_00645 [Planctomycetes bacterium SCN 63-9]|nr:MAG: hypothetical protein ABS79_00645 [Planctomycetes bacterium SCN 63-9]
MRIELDASALERLLGGDTEVTIHLRQLIVNEFCKKQLKPLLNDAVFRRVSAEWEAQLRKELDARLAELKADFEERSERPGLPSSLQWNLGKAVKQAAQAAVDAAVRDIIEYQKRHWTREIAEAVERAIPLEIEKAVAAGVQARLEAAARLGGPPGTGRADG